MSRVEKRNTSHRAMAFGVDILPPHTCTNVWDTTELEWPCSEEGCSNILVSEWGISQERVLDWRSSMASC